MNVFELLFYLIIARGLWKQNHSMVGILTNKTIQKRQRGSTLTLSGQVISFIVETMLFLWTVVAVKVIYKMLNIGTIQYCITII